MIADSRIREAVRDDMLEEIPNLIMEGRETGMCLMDDSLIELCQEGRISNGYAVRFAMDKDRVLSVLGEDIIR